MHATSVSLFLNGLEEDGTALDTQTLAGPVDDIISESALWIGRSSNGNDFCSSTLIFQFLIWTFIYLICISFFLKL